MVATSAARKMLNLFFFFNQIFFNEVKSAVSCRAHSRGFHIYSKYNFGSFCVRKLMFNLNSMSRKFSNDRYLSFEVSILVKDETAFVYSNVADGY